MIVPLDAEATVVAIREQETLFRIVYSVFLGVGLVFMFLNRTLKTA